MSPDRHPAHRSAGRAWGLRPTAPDRVSRLFFARDTAAVSLRTGSLARVDAVHDGAVADRCHADGLLAGVNLVHDSVRPYPERSEAGQTATEGMAGEWLAFEKTEGVLDGIDQRPTELEQLATGSPREDDPRHASAGRSAFSQLAAELGERDRLAAYELGQAGVDRGERVGIGEDLGGFLQRLVFVDRDQRGCRLAVARHEDVIAAVGNIAE
jgi:hypothetical protein